MMPAYMPAESRNRIAARTHLLTFIAAIQFFARFKASSGAARLPPRVRRSAPQRWFQADCPGCRRRGRIIVWGMKKGKARFDRDSDKASNVPRSNSPAESGQKTLWHIADDVLANPRSIRGGRGPKGLMPQARDEARRRMPRSSTELFGRRKRCTYWAELPLWR